VLLVAGVAVAVALFAVGGYFAWKHLRPVPLPEPGSPLYEEYVDAFQVGTAALDSGLLNERAVEKLSEAIDKIPEEPASWANRGLCYLRMGELKKAADDLQRAGELAPGNAAIEALRGSLAERSDKYGDALAHFRKGLEAEPDNVRWLYQLYQLTGREGADDADAQQQQLLDRILQVRPTSLFILSERLGLAVKRRDVAVLRDTVARLDRLSTNWSPDAQKALAALREDAKRAALPPDVLGRVLAVQNLLRAEPGYPRDSTEINPSGAAVGTSFQTFLRLKPVQTAPSPPDREMTIVVRPIRLQPQLEQSKVRGDQAVFPAWLNARENPAILVASAKEVRRVDAAGLVLPFPSGAGAVAPSIDGVLSIDWNNDELIDLVLAGAGGLRFYRHVQNKGYEDVTAQTKLPQEILQGDYHGAWAADVEMDGDLDVIVAPRKGAPFLLRNNFDGTFTAQRIFPGVEGARAFAWVDLDNDGAPDAVFLDSAGKLHVFMNKRSGVFARREAPDAEARYAALAVADVNDDGVLDLVAIRKNGTVVRVSDKDKGKSWDMAELARLQKDLPLVPGEVRLVAVDLDNNGAVDLVLRTNQGGQVWLADGKGAFHALDAEVPDGTADVISLDCSGRLDLLGYPRPKEGTQATLGRWSTQGTKDYRWYKLRARANPLSTGDNRVNSLALGSEVEARTGSLVVKQPIDRPVVHFGLGTRKKVAVMRLVWTNGAPQFEFDKDSDAVIDVLQRLTGSCPFLFTNDGKKMVFVSDFCWSTPLGMYVNAQDNGALQQTTDWVKIRGDQLAAIAGYYDVRVNANLWETHYLDHLSLMVVDHPPSTEMHVDERFFLTPTAPQLYLTGPSRPVARALDHKGNDVTDIVRAVDARYLDRAGRGAFQGITADHWVEVDLGEDAPKEGPVYLLAHGWIHPTDSSINVALEQGNNGKPMPLTLEVPDGTGGWKVGQAGLGFPAGKNKTCVIRLDGIEGKGVSRRFRLRTNLEIYWDALHYAAGLDASKCVRKHLLPERAELRFRGILRMSQAGPGAPELPHYDEVVCRTQHWRDLTGFHTRFGDVRELLEKIDDRYVIMNAGDEIRLGFQAPPDPPAGWKRDFVWVCDGWVKDGNMGTRFGKTVLPLPYHGMKSYDTPPGRLEDDPVWRRFPKDWEVYHTRYLTPTVFERGLRNFTRPRE
jgi:tetratricopeptide (TPR) repeat protein